MLTIYNSWIWTINTHSNLFDPNYSAVGRHSEFCLQGTGLYAKDETATGGIHLV